MKKEEKKGFTIIEVVMVLAIAGLIFAIVFAAFPRVQRSRRDSQRKTDLSSLAGELEFYQSANRGNYPSDLPSLQSLINGLSIDFNDPSTGLSYPVTYQSNLTNTNQGTPATTAGSIKYRDRAECSADNTHIDSTDFNRNYALVIRLESGVYCIDI